MIAQGRRTRVSPQGYLYAGPFGVLAEYVQSTQHVKRATNLDALTTQAWQVSGGWVLTGERESYTGIAPNHPLDGGSTGGFGALELVARYGVLTTDADASRSYADPATQPRQCARRGDRPQLAADAWDRVRDELRAHAALRIDGGNGAVDGARGADAVAGGILMPMSLARITRRLIERRSADLERRCRGNGRMN